MHICFVHHTISTHHSKSKLYSCWFCSDLQKYSHKWQDEKSINLFREYVPASSAVCGFPVVTSLSRITWSVAPFVEFSHRQISQIWDDSILLQKHWNIGWTRPRQNSTLSSGELVCLYPRRISFAFGCPSVLFGELLSRFFSDVHVKLDVL